MGKGYVGSRMPRVDAKGKVTGTTMYAGDYSFPDMLHLKVLRAPHPHCRITRICTEEAKGMPGVVQVITAEDIPWVKNYGMIHKDQEVLVREKTRYMGDALALVAARSLWEAQRALSVIKVEYEELEVLENPSQAMKEDAVKIHETGNVLCVHHLIKGDVELGFKEADHIVEGSYSTGFVEHVALQVESGVAYYDEEKEEYTLIVATQWLHDTQLDMAQSLGVKKSQVRIINPAIGGAFGKREDISVHLYLAIMAKLTKKPVRLELTREESILSCSKRHPISFTMKTGVKKDGTLTALEVTVVGDTGCYASTGSAVVPQALYVSTGPYVIPHVKGIAHTVYTNNTFCGAMRGFGATQAAFAYESHMDVIAQVVGIDRFALRMKNALDVGSKTGNGQVLTASVGVKECIEKTLQRYEKSEKPLLPHKKRGVGLATTLFGCGYGEGFPDHAIVHLCITKEGRIQVKTAAAEVGQGVFTVVSQIVADVVGVPLTTLDLIPQDTSMKNAGSTSASRQTIFSGNAALLAAEALLGQIYQVATQFSGAGYPEVKVEDGVIGMGEERMSLAHLHQKALELGLSLEAEGCYFPRTDIDRATGQGERVYVAVSFNTQLAEVEVDTQTGQVEVTRMINAVDVGRAIYPLGIEGQTEGASVMGLGMALLEEQVLQKGITRNPNLSTYLIPTSLDCPDVETLIVESKDAAGPFGAKGVGEPAMLGAVPAITNAIYDAVGVRLTQVPATPTRLLQLINEKEG